MKNMHKNSIAIVATLSLGLSLLSPLVSFAASPETVNLGTAGNFTILAKSGISTTGSTVVVGDIGVSPVSATYITGFGLILPVLSPFSKSTLVTGKVYASDYTIPTPTNLTTAIGDMQTAYNDAVGRVNPTATELGSGNIGGLTIAPGIYKWGTSVIIPSDVTLSGGPNDVWIFQVAQTLILSSATKINLTGGAQAGNIFWVVTGQATIGTNAVFNGNILGKTSIVLNTGAKLNGRALAQTAVTLDANAVTVPQVSAVVAPARVVTASVPALPVANSITYSVATDKATYNQDENIVITITATNSGSTPQTLNFTNGCQTSYTVAGYDSSKNVTCTMALTSAVVPAKSSKNWVTTHRVADYRLPVGDQKIIGKVYGYGSATTAVTIIPVLVLKVPAIVKPSVTVISPNTGDAWKVGDSKKVSIGVVGAPTGSYLQTALVEGPTPIEMKGFSSPVGTITFDYVLPTSGCYTDYCNQLKPGAYKVMATLYDKAPCNMRASCIQETALASDGSDVAFLVSTSATAVPTISPVATKPKPDTIVSSMQASSKPISCPVGKKVLCSAGMLKDDGTDTSVCTCVTDAKVVVTPAVVGKEVKVISGGLWEGSRGTDVANLQQFLIALENGSAAQALSKVGATAYFGALTRAALIEFQNSVGITPALGNFGERTRAYLGTKY